MDTLAITVENGLILDRIQRAIYAYRKEHLTPVGIVLGPRELMSFRYFDKEQLTVFGLPVFLQERAGLTILVKADEAAALEYRKQSHEIGWAK